MIYLLMPWHLVHSYAGHQQPWYWQFKIGPWFPGWMPTSCSISVWENISMGLCKKDVTPLLMHWSYIFLALTHQYKGANAYSALKQLIAAHDPNNSQYPLYAKMFPMLLILLCQFFTRFSSAVETIICCDSSLGSWIISPILEFKKIVVIWSQHLGQRKMVFPLILN